MPEGGTSKLKVILTQKQKSCHIVLSLKWILCHSHWHLNVVGFLYTNFFDEVFLILLKFPVSWLQNRNDHLYMYTHTRHASLTLCIPPSF
jgi:hypothetical protein